MDSVQNDTLFTPRSLVRPMILNTGSDLASDPVHSSEISMVIGGVDKARDRPRLNPARYQSRIAESANPGFLYRSQDPFTSRPNLV